MVPYRIFLVPLPWQHLSAKKGQHQCANSRKGSGTKMVQNEPPNVAAMKAMLWKFVLSPTKPY